MLRQFTPGALHITKTSSHPSICLDVHPDPSRSSYDRNCLKVTCPPLESINSVLLDEVVWPKNEKSKRYEDQLVRHIVGKKVGSVPANLCGMLKELLDSGKVRRLTCYSTASKPRRSESPPAHQKFAKRFSGKDRPGGGVVLDCKYVLAVKASWRKDVIDEIRDFLSSHNGNEALQLTVEES